jgi:predicted glycoside hydrolase/deacetylase ChbG (UPF0249 family)
MKALIVNADGFGFSPGCNRGIVEAIAHGIVTSVSVNMNFPPAKDVIQLQKDFPGISIGIHLNAIVGPPMSHIREVPSLLNPVTGEFWGGAEFTRRLTLGKILRRELESELTLQVQTALDWGISVTHVDSQQQRHLHPFYFPVFLRVGYNTGILKMRTHNYYLSSPGGPKAVRSFYLRHPGKFLIHTLNRTNMALAKTRGFRMADRNLAFTLLSQGATYLLQNWVFVLKHLPAGYNEVVIHPAYPDDALAKYASYTAPRDSERTLLQASILREIIAQEGVQLVSFRELL